MLEALIAILIISFGILGMVGLQAQSMRQVNDAVSRHGINILAQYLQTDPEVGYVVLETDVVGGEGEELLADLKAVPGTIRVRVLYDQSRPQG